MAESRDLAPDWLIRWEPWLVLAICAGALTAIPVGLGHIGLSWDALNHHIYLGWVAEHPRFDRDYLAASYQAYQYPYLYWPVYKLATAGAGGVTAGVVLAMLQVPAVPPVWMLARVCIPGRQWFDLAMRVIAVALAFTSALVLSLFDSTANDLLAAIPLLWAIALAFEPWRTDRAPMNVCTAIALSGLLAGIAVAFKLSNGPIALVLPLVWLWHKGSARDRIVRLALAGLWAAAGFALAYGYWGSQLWTHFGNPIYPLYDGWFEPLRRWWGWRP